MKKWLGVLFSLLLGLGVIAFCSLSAARLQQAISLREPAGTVVLDAGHGGEDGGASSKSGILESRLNLQITLRLRDLCAFCGIKPVTVRTTDTSVYDSGCSSVSEKKVSDLKNRVTLVNRTPNAILISIHQNFFPQEKYAGAQVFYAGTDGSRSLAEHLQGSLRLADPDNHRECKRSESVYLMEHISCTGVLIECGFLSNESECLRLTEPDYQKKLTSCICGGLLQYLCEERANEV